MPTLYDGDAEAYSNPAGQAYPARDMNRRRFLPFAILVAVLLLFFRLTVLRGLVPFPGDLLLSEYQPWRSYPTHGYVAGSVPHKAQYPDTLRQIYPWRIVAAEQWRKGSVPLWNPHNFSGTPLAANFQSAVFYPPNLLFAVTQPAAAWTALVILSHGAALLFMYVYLRKVGLSPAASVTGAVAYAFSAFAAVWSQYNSIVHVAAFLPLMLLSLELAAGTRSSLPFVLYSIAISLAILAGHPQVAFYQIMFSAFYAVVRVRKRLLFILTAIITGIALAAVQVIPGVELMLLSARTGLNIPTLLNKILIQPAQLLMLVVPDIFGNPATRTYFPGDTYIGKVTSVGFAGLVLAATAVLRKKPHRLTGFLVVSVMAVLALVMRNPVTVHLYAVGIPFVSSGNPTLAVVLLTFCLATLSAIGLDTLLSDPKIAKVSALLATVLIGIAWTGAALIVLAGSGSPMFAIKTPLLATVKSTAFAASFLFAALLMVLKVRRLIPAAIIFTVLTGELMLMYWKFNPFVPASYIFPDTVLTAVIKRECSSGKVIGNGAALLTPNTESQLGIDSPAGYDPLYPGTYGEFISSVWEGRVIENAEQFRSDAVLPPVFGSDPALTSRVSRAIDALNVTCIIGRSGDTTVETADPARYGLIYDRDGFQVYRNLKAVGNFVLFDSYTRYNNKYDFGSKFFADGGRLLLETVPDPQPQPRNGADKTEVTVKQPDYIELNVTVSGNRILYLPETWYPGWTASLDGRTVPVIRANYAFRAVSVPAGAHTVILAYRPASFKTGVIISFVSAGIIILFTAIAVIQPGKERR
ncbi:hypothetical protein A2Z33_02920 [Candidatus Gottesmanbacteria bacterium RBG_16_52_11]|uniref:Membrane protein 6-pyruvoyl-tetrahydropterin synthase-related domain-containing protein n=1 Tax=Candidatus Gottesmanbacteria bacterium RBG_16_52_11 TaxID=1798374 RepID=A0A1F5YMD3_9BACT|nr:MAG: hypothetical protein A2Z33_02920 [Candidatus Gottesmanbacteria bacterium RBG_16_52_11]